MEENTFLFEGYCLDPWGWDEWVLKLPDTIYESRWWFREGLRRYIKKEGGKVPNSLFCNDWYLNNKTRKKIIVFYRKRPIDKKPIFAIKISSILFYKYLLFRRKFQYICIARGDTIESRR